MSTIDRATAIKLASDAGMKNIDHIKWRGSYNKCTVPEKFEIDSVVRLCNSAIQWHAAQAAQPVREPCFMCRGTGWHFMATAHLPGQPEMTPIKVECKQCKTLVRETNNAEITGLSG